MSYFSVYSPAKHYLYLKYTHFDADIHYDTSLYPIGNAMLVELFKKTVANVGTFIISKDRKRGVSNQW